MTGQKYGLPVLCPVDEKGMMTAEAGEFEGLSYIECNARVIDRLKELGHLLLNEPYGHSYPYAERDGKPVIFRATDQWFVSIDMHHLRKHLIAKIDDVLWFPKSGRERIRAMVSNRPDWCISRQRPWGVGIPIFYGRESGVPVLDPVAIEAAADLVERGGSDAWFTTEPSEILPQGYSHPETGETEFTKEQDVFDVWFDSGSSSLCVLEGEVEPAWKEDWPCDLYLEGSDQHRGWFNCSLIIGMITRKDAPYRTVVTHGFVNDEQGRKMSKRLGNVVEPIETCNKIGADVLRYWAASVNYEDDMPCGENLLGQCGESYRRVRNTFKYLLSNLSDFEPSMKPDMLLDLDQWIIERSEILCKNAVQAYENFAFNEALSLIHNFCSQELSSFYLDAIKDRMYCDATGSPERRSGQSACHTVLLKLVKLVAPILVHTAEEVYERIPGLVHLATVHAEEFEVPSDERMEDLIGNELETRFAAMLSYRGAVFAQFEQWKLGAGIKDSQDVVCTITDNPEIVENLSSFGDELAVLFKMSSVDLHEGDPNVEFAVSEFEKCERCRLRRPGVVSVSVDGVAHLLSSRCRKVLGL